MILGDHHNDERQSTEATVKSETQFVDDLENELLSYIAKSKAIFKSQQKDEPELTFDEKRTIALNVLKKSKCLFLSKFGHYLQKDHLKYFDKYKTEDYEVSYHINRLQRYFNSTKRQIDIKNRRYEALKIMIDKGDYFSECEMMKRNPLLYDHLIGQYLTEKQKKARDNIDLKNITFVNLLMESIERKRIKERQQLQQEEEDSVLEENDDDDSDEEYIDEQTDSTMLYNSWGDTTKKKCINERSLKMQSHKISNKEKQVLRQEFVTNMYQNFLDGRDSDFDYSTVDDNEAYDNVDLRTQDEEEKYFDSESPEAVIPKENVDQNESEDELDAYMKSLKEQTSANVISMGNKI